MVEEKTIEQQREEDIIKMTSEESRFQMLFWYYYLNPVSPTLMDAEKSALRAGFTDEEAKHVKMYKWFRRGVLKDEVFDLGESVLKEMLKLSTITTKILKDGTEVTVTDPSLVKIKQDTAKYITSTLGKKDYSARTEFTGKEGGAIETKKTIVGDKEFEDIINAYATKRNNKRKSEDSSPKENI